MYKFVIGSVMLMTEDMIIEWERWEEECAAVVVMNIMMQ